MADDNTDYTGGFDPSDLIAPGETPAPAPMQSVQVASSALNPRPAYTGLSPIKSALLYGGAAAAVGGPLVGALVGGAVGLVRKLQTDNAIDHQARMVADVVNESAGLQQQVMSMMPNADEPTQKFLMQQLRNQREGMNRFLSEGDPAGREIMDRANINIAGVLSDQMHQLRDEATARAGAQRELITSAAQGMRGEHQAAMDAFTGVETQANKVLSLANEPDFDPNKPINKELVSTMLATGVGGLYRENPMDYLSAVSQGVSGLQGLPGKAGTIAQVGGAILGAVSDYTKSEQFILKKEDYIRLAVNMKDYAAKQAQQKFDVLGKQAAFLDQQARAWGVFTPETNLHDYVSGSVDKLPITPTPELPPAPTPRQLYNGGPATSNRSRSLSLPPPGVLQFNRVQSLTRQTAVQNQDQGLSQAQAPPLRPVN